MPTNNNTSTNAERQLNKLLQEKVILEGKLQELDTKIAKAAVNFAAAKAAEKAAKAKNNNNNNNKNKNKKPKKLFMHEPPKNNRWSSRNF
jgi:septal ring factor EnvC (AmiA/AmiB activator)